MKKLNALLVGLGNIGLNYDYYSKDISTHAKSLYLSNKVKIYAAVDKNAYQRKKFQKKYKLKALKALPNKSELEKIDLIIISVNTDNHLKIINKIIKSKRLKTILIEKPCGVNFREYSIIKNLCKKNKKKLFINFQRIYDKEFINLKHYFQKLRNFKGTVFYSRGLINNGSHIFSLLFLAGLKPIKYKIIKKNINPDFILYFETGYIIFFSNPNKSISNNEIEIIGDKIKISSSNELNKFYIYKLKKDSFIKNNFFFKEFKTIVFNYKISQKIVLDSIIKLSNNKYSFDVFDDAINSLNKIILSK